MTGLVRGTGRVLANVVGGLDDALGVLVGAGKEAVNAVGNLLTTPHRAETHKGFPFQGAVFEPSSSPQRTGAAAVRAALRADGLLSAPADRAAEAQRRPLLAERVVDVREAAQMAVVFDARAPGADWSRRTGAAGLASVYVDGRHTGDVTVFAESSGTYEVNVGRLSPGAHRIEIRDAREAASAIATRTEIGTVTARALSGAQALVARFQPILEGRDLGRPGGSAESAFTDAPLLMRAITQSKPDGTSTIEYRALFSNEDGGTRTSELLRTHGRTTDWEPVYRVTVDAGGAPVSEEFQGPRHRWQSFTGSRRGERPVLRVATANNNFSQQTAGSGTAWSGLATPAVPARSFEVMLQQPWTFEVMAKELIRQGKAPAGVSGQVRGVHHPSRYLFLAGQSDGLRLLLEGGGVAQLVLRDGRRLPLRLDSPSKNPQDAAAIPLPAGISGAEVVRLEGAEGAAWVLGADLRPTPVRTHARSR